MPMPSKRLPLFSNWLQNVPRRIETDTACDRMSLAAGPGWTAARQDAGASRTNSSTDEAEQLAMKAIKTYSTRVDADLARITLDAVGIPSVVVGVGVGMEGGTGGVQLLVEDDRVERALNVLGDA
jgi:hypothetical protein